VLSSFLIPLWIVGQYITEMKRLLKHDQKDLNEFISSFSHLKQAERQTTSNEQVMIIM